VVVTNTLNGTTAAATSAAATLTVTPKPVAVAITAQPQSATVTAPDGKTFSVTATGANLSYVWKNGSGTVVGTDSPTFTVAATDLHTVSQTYTVTVTSGTASVVSDPATLTVVAPKPVYAGDPTVTDTSRVYAVVPSFITTAPADASGSFRVGYDTGKLSPVWSSACFFPSAPWTFTRPSDYPTDTRIAGSLVSADYSGTGYSRGHMTQFANLRDVYGADAGASTMYMSNMCPQVQAGFNDAAWNDLEVLTTQNLTTSFGRVWIYTGPIFSTSLVAPIGAKNIPVATAFYKIMVREEAGVPKVLALIVPHSTTISGTAGPTVAMAAGDFWKFATTVDRVQELTGLNFFPVPSSPLPATFTSVVDVTGWGNTLEQGPNRPNVHMIKPSWDSTFTHVHNTSSAVNTIATYNALVGEAVPFEGQATGDPDAIVSTSWTFGDGATATTPSTTHVYTTGGSFTVTFTATDAQNHTSSISRVVSITSPSPTTPTFTTQPQAQTVFAGNAVFFSAVATGNGTLTYQWQKDGVDLVGKTTASLKLTAVTAADNGTYTVIVTNTSGSSSLTATSNGALLTVNAIPASDMYEGFETGTKTGYAAGTLTLSTGSWTLTDSLLASSTLNGGSTNDHFLGLAGMRLRNSSPGGKATMNFDWALGAQTVSVTLAKYGSEAPGPVGLYSSIDGGTTWVHVTPDYTPASTTPTTVTWTVGIAGAVRFELRRMDAAFASTRACIDDFHIVGY